MNLYLFCGVSGAGKTYLGKELQKANPQSVFFDVDEYYAAINGDECIRDNSFEVWHKLFRDIHEVIVHKQNVIVTTNAIHRYDRQDFITWFPEAIHHLIWISAPLEKCLSQNMMRRRKIPSAIISSMYYNAEIPDNTEWEWDSITHIIYGKDNSRVVFKVKEDIEKFINWF